MSQLESYIPGSAQELYYQNTLPASALTEGNSLLAQVAAQQAANPPQVDYDIAALAGVSQLSEAQKQAIKQSSPDTYNYIYDRNSFRALHGDEALYATDAQVAQRITPNPIDTRNGYERAKDYALGVGQGAVQGILGIGAVATVPGSPVSNAIANAANAFTEWTTQNLGSDFINKAQEANARKSPGRSAISELQWKLDKAEGYGDLSAGLRQIGRDFLRAGRDLLRDPGALEQATTNAFGSLAIAAPLSKAISAFGSALAKGSVANSMASKVGTRLAATEGRTIAQKVFGNEGLTNAILETGGSVESAVEAVNSLSTEQLLANPQFVERVNEYINQGLSSEAAFRAAKEELASSVARTAALLTPFIAAPAGALADKVIRSPFRFTGRSLNPLRWGQEVLERGGKEATEEGIQGFQKLGENLGMQQAGFDTHLWEGIGEESASGAIAGGISGAGGPIIGTAARAVALPAVGAAKLYQSSDQAQTRTAQQAMGDLNKFQQEIENDPNLSQSEKDLWKQRLQAVSGKVTLDTATTDSIEKTIGQELSEETKKTFDDDKSIIENIIALRRKAEKLEKKDAATAQTLYNDIEDILTYGRDRSQDQNLASAMNKEQEILQGFVDLQNKNKTSDEAKLAEALQISDAKKQLNTVSDLMSVPSSLKQKENESPEDFAQRQADYKDQKAQEYIAAYARLAIKDKANNTKSSIDMAETMLPKYAEFNVGNQKYNQVFDKQLEQLQKQSANLLKQNVQAQVSSIQRQLNKLKNKPNLNAARLIARSLLNSGSSPDVQEAAGNKFLELAKNSNITKDFASHYENLGNMLKAMARAKQAYANNPEFKKAKNNPQLVQKFFGNNSNILTALTASSTDQNKLQKQQITIANKHSAITQALKDLASNPKQKETQVSFWDAMEAKEQTYTLQRHQIKNALQEERQLFLTHKALEYRGDVSNHSLTSDVANLTRNDFNAKQDALQKATFKSSYQTQQKLEEAQNTITEESSKTSQTEPKTTTNEISSGQALEPEKQTTPIEETKEEVPQESVSQSTVTSETSTPKSSSIQNKKDGQHNDWVADINELMSFYNAILEGRDIIIIDTETTGTNTKSDEIVQIAAYNPKTKERKIWYIQQETKNGKVVHSIPEYFVDTDGTGTETSKTKNPMFTEHPAHKNEWKSFDQAWTELLDFVGSSDIIGHNLLKFDLEILRNNAASKLNEKSKASANALDKLTHWDTLPLARLEDGNPEHWRTKGYFKLDHLREVWGLDEENAHLAESDVEATAALMDHLYASAYKILEKHERDQRTKTTEDAAKEQAAHAVAEANAKALIAFHENIEESPEPDVIQKQDITNVIRNDGEIFILTGSHLAFKQHSNGMWTHYALNPFDRGLQDVEEQSVSSELVNWLQQQVVPNFPILQEDVPFYSATVSLSNDEIGKIRTYTDNVVRIYDKNNKLLYERMETGQWVIYTSRNDMPFVLASNTSNEYLENNYKTLKVTVSVMHKDAYGRDSANIAIQNLQEANMRVLSDGALFDSESKTRYYFTNGKWHIGTKNSKTVVSNKNDVKVLNHLVAATAIKKASISPTLLSLYEHFFLKEEKGVTYSLEFENNAETENPFSINIYKNQEGQKSLIAKRTVTNGERTWFLQNASGKLDSVVDSNAGIQAMEVFASMIDQGKVDQFYEYAQQQPSVLLTPSQSLTKNIQSSIIDAILFGGLDTSFKIPENIRRTLATIQKYAEEHLSNFLDEGKDEDTPRQKFLKDVATNLRDFFKKQKITHIDSNHLEELQQFVIAAASDVMQNRKKNTMLSQIFEMQKNSYELPSMDDLATAFANTDLGIPLSRIDWTGLEAQTIYNAFAKEMNKKTLSGSYAYLMAKAHKELKKVLKDNHILDRTENLIMADSKAFAEISLNSTPETLGIFHEMPSGLAGVASTLYNALQENNLLNRLADPLADLDTFFNVICPKWVDLPPDQHKKAFLTFVYGNGEGNVRGEKLYTDIFFSEKGQNLKALQNFFANDSSRSLLYKLLEDMDLLLEDVSPEVKNYFARHSESTGAMWIDLGHTNSHNPNFFFLTTNAKGETVWNKSLLSRAMLGAISTYFTMNQTENRDPEKDSINLSLFNYEDTVKSQIMSAIGLQAETDEHIEQQIASNIREFLGLKHTGRNRQFTIEDAIVHSISKTILAAMVKNGLFTKHTVNLYLDGNEQFSRVEASEVISERSYVSRNKKNTTTTVRFGKPVSSTINRKSHVFLTVNRANDPNTDLMLHKLASGMTAQLAFLLENLIIEKHNENIGIGEENKFKAVKEGTVYHSSEKLTPTQLLEIKNLDDVASYLNESFNTVLDTIDDEVIFDFFDAQFSDKEMRAVGNIFANESQKGINVSLATMLRDAKDLKTQFGNYKLARQQQNLTDIDTAEIPVFFKHAITTMGRFMMTGGANTQTSKLLRELFIPSSHAKVADRYIDLKNTQMSNFLLRAIAAGFGVKVNQAGGLITSANQFLHDQLTTKIGQLISSPAWTKFQQAIKENSLTKAQTTDLLKTLHDCKDADHTWLAINACVELARFMNATETNTLEELIDPSGNINIKNVTQTYLPNMYIENDGVTSGPSHTQHLLSTGMYTIQELKAKAAGGYSFAPGSYADAFALTGKKDIYMQNAAAMNEWLDIISNSWSQKHNNADNMLIAKVSRGVTNEGTVVSLPVSTFNSETGEIEQGKTPEVVTPVRILTSILNALHIAIPKGFKNSEKELFTSAMLGEVELNRQFVKDPFQGHTYEAGRATITKSMLNIVIQSFLSMQGRHNVWIQKEGKNSEHAKELRKQITELAMHLQQAALITISDSMYNDAKGTASFLTESNTESLNPNLWMPQIDEATGLYDTKFTLGPKALDILTKNMQHLLLNPMIDRLEQKVYSPESIKNKKILTGVSNVLGTLYEGIEAYYFAEIMKQNKTLGSPITEDQIRAVSKKLRSITPKLVEKLELDFTLSGEEKKVKLDKEISLLKEQMLRTTIRNAFPNMFPKESDMDNLFKSGNSLFTGEGTVNPQASISIRGHTNNGVASMIQSIQGLAEAAIIAAGAQAKINISDQFDGMNAAIDELLGNVSKFNNEAVAQIWQKLNVFEVFRQTLEQFTHNLNAKDNSELLAIIDQHLKVKVNVPTEEQIQKQIEQQKEKTLRESLTVSKDTSKAEKTYLATIQQKDWAYYDKYKEPELKQADKLYSPWQMKLAKHLQNLAEAAGMERPDGKLIASQLFRQMLFKVEKLHIPANASEALKEKIDRMNADIQQVEDSYYHPGLMGEILSKAQAKLQALAEDSVIRREAWRYVGKTYCDQLASTAQASETPVKTGLKYKDIDGHEHIYEPKDFFEGHYDANGQVDWTTYKNEAELNDVFNHMVNELNHVYAIIRNDKQLVKQLFTEASEDVETFAKNLMEVKTEQELRKLHTNVAQNITHTGSVVYSITQALRFSAEHFANVMGVSEEELKTNKNDLNVIYKLIEELANHNNGFLHNTLVMALPEISDQTIKESLEDLYPDNQQLQEAYFKGIKANLNKQTNGLMLITDSQGKAHQLIVLNTKAIEENNQNKSEVLLHELMHAAFDFYVHTYLKFSPNGDIQVSSDLRHYDPQAYAWLTSIKNIYVKELPGLMANIGENQTLAKLQKLILPQQGMSSEQREQQFKEFIAYALSNRDLIQLLLNNTSMFTFKSTVESVRQEIQAAQKQGLLKKISDRLLEIIKSTIKFLSHVLTRQFKQYTTISPVQIEQKFGARTMNNLAWGFQALLKTDSYGTLFKQQTVEPNQTYVSQMNILQDTEVLAKQGNFNSNINTEEVLASKSFSTFDQDLAYLVPEKDIKEHSGELAEIWTNWFKLSIQSSVNSEFGQRYAFLATEMAPLLTEDIFYPNDNPTNQEKIDARQKHDILLNFFNEPIETSFGRISKGIPVILSLAKTNARLQSKMQQTQISKQKFEKKGVHTVDEFLQATATKAIAWITDQIDPVIAQDTNLADAFENLHTVLQTKLDTIENKVGTPFNDLLTTADTKTKTFIEKTLNALAESDSTWKRIIGTGLQAVFLDQDAKYMKNHIRKTLNMHSDVIPRFISDLTTDIMGVSDEDIPILFLAKRAKSHIQQLRQSYRKQMPAEIRNMFNNELSTEEWESLYTSLGSTGIWALPLYAPKLVEQLHLFLAPNSTQLEKQISSYEDRIQQQVSKRAYNLIIPKTQQLGHYMATHEAGNMLIRNTWAIGMLYNNSIDETLENDLSVLASLYAIKDLSENDKKILSNVWVKHEEATKDIINIISYAQEVEQNKLKAYADTLNNSSAFFNNKMHEYYRIRMNAYQNFMPMESIEGSSMIIAADEKQQMLRQKGYVRQGDYENKLDEGKRERGYYYSTIAQEARYLEGVISITSPTYNGIYVNTGQSIQGSEHNLITNPRNVAKITQNMEALGSSVQSETGDDLIPVFHLDKNGNIQIYAYERSFNKEQNQRINKHYQLADSIGILQGRQIEETVGKVLNFSLGSLLIQEFKRANENTAEFIDITDPKQMNVIQRHAVDRIPSSLMYILKKQFEAAECGEHIYIRKDIFKDIVGERAISIREAFNPESSDLNKTVLNMTEKCLRKMFGDNAFRYAVRGEEALQKVVSWAKSTIVIRALRLVLINGVSNIYQLSTNGVPFVEIMREIPKMFSQCETYVRSFTKLRSLELRLQAATNEQEKKQIMLQLKTIQSHIQTLDIYPIIDEFSVINELGRNADDMALTRGQFGDWMVDYVRKYVPEPIRNVGRYALMTQDTAIFQGLEKATQYGDFIAKAILYKHFIKTKKYTAPQARRIVMDEFVNYDKARGRVRQYAESTGVLWFGDYMFKIMQTMGRLLRTNPVRFLLTANLPNYVPLLNIDAGDPVTDSWLGKIFRGLGLANFGPGLIKTAWDNLPFWWFFGLA